MLPGIILSCCTLFKINKWLGKWDMYNNSGMLLLVWWILLKRKKSLLLYWYFVLLNISIDASYAPTISYLFSRCVRRLISVSNLASLLSCLLSVSSELSCLLLQVFDSISGPAIQFLQFLWTICLLYLTVGSLQNPYHGSTVYRVLWLCRLKL